MGSPFRYNDWSNISVITLERTLTAIRSGTAKPFRRPSQARFEMGLAVFCLVRRRVPHSATTIEKTYLILYYFRQLAHICPSLAR